MKTIFARRQALGVRFVMCVLLSVFLMIMDRHHSPFFLRVQAVLDQIVSPLEYVVEVPFRTGRWIVDHLATQRRLLAENVALRTQQFLLQARLQRLLSVERENAELHTLLHSTAQVEGKMVTARLLAVDIRSGGLEQVIVNKGARAGIHAGQAVLDAYGVMGQVVSASADTSKVLLLTDMSSAIPVQNYRNGMRSVAAGQGDARHLMLLNVSETADIRVGDLFISSGLGQHYPAGYPVGSVIRKETIPGGRLVRVLLKPTACLNSSEQVLLVNLIK